MSNCRRVFLVTSLMTVVSLAGLAWADQRFRFDMGGPDTPIRKGYVQVLPSSTYSPEKGHGWEQPVGKSFESSHATYNNFGTIWQAVDATEEADELTIDGIASPDDMTFVLALPPGSYRVIALVGDVGASRFKLAVYANEKLITDAADAFILRDRGWTVDSDRGGVMRVRFTAEPRDGVLRIKFAKSDRKGPLADPTATASSPDPQKFTSNSVLGIEIYPFAAMPLQLSNGKLVARPEAGSPAVSAALEAYNSGDVQKAANLFAAIADENLLLTKAAGLLWAAGNLNLDLEFQRRIQADPELRGNITIDRVKFLARAPDLWTDMELVEEARKALAQVLPKQPDNSAANELMMMATISQEAQRLFDRDPAIVKHYPMWITDSLCRQIFPDDPLYPRALWYRARIHCGINPEMTHLTWTRGVTLWRELQTNFPDDEYVKMYLLKSKMTEEVILRPGEAVPAAPPIHRKYEWGYEGAPAWAASLRDTIGWWIDVVEWWGNNRQMADGSIGGGWSDDVEILRDWWVVAASGLSPRAYETVKKLSDGIWNADIMNREWGMEAHRADAEHITEMSADSHPHMVFLDYGNPTYVERCMISFKPIVEFFSGINAKGHRHVKAWHYGPEWIDPDPAGALDSTYNGRLQPAGISVAWYNRNPMAAGALVEWAKAWVEDAKSTDKGKPAGFMPLGVAFADCEQGSPGSKYWFEAPYAESIADSSESASSAFFPQSFAYHRCLLAYNLTGDKSFLEPFDAAWQMASEAMKTRVENPALGSREWVGTRLASGYYSGEFAILMGRVREATGTTKYDDFILKAGKRISNYGREMEWSSLEYARYLIDHNKEHIVNGADAISHTVNARGFEMLTSEVFMTDRAGFGALLEAFVAGCVSGSVISWGLSMPEMSVTWEGFDKQLTPLVAETDESHLKVLAYDFSGKARGGLMRLWRLKPGWRYTVTIGPDSNGDDVADQIRSSASIDLMHRGDGVPIAMEPRVTQVIEVKAAQKLRDVPDTLPDVGISSEDIAYDGKQLHVKVHNTGSLPVDGLQVEMYEGKTKIGAALVDRLEPANDLVPRTATVSLDWAPASKPARVTCVLDPADEIYEITERNNKANATVGR